MPSSSTPSAFLAVDLGSSSGRVMLGVLRTDAAGVPLLTVSESSRFANVPLVTPDGLSWNVDALWDAVQSGLRTGIDQARLLGARIAGIGVDSWGVDYGRLTVDGDLRPFVRHHRDVDVALAARSSAARDVAADYAITGVLDQAINTAHQLRQDAADGIGAPDDRILLFADLFVHLLTGVAASEASLASSTALLDRGTGHWSAQLTRGLLGTLPPVVAAGGLAGVTRPGVTERIGADDPVPVWFTTAHDTAAAFSAVVDASLGGETAVVSCGSWAVVGVALERPVLTDAARLAGFTQEIGAGGETLLVKNLSGMWLLQEAMREWSEVDGRDGWSVEPLRALLDEAAASTFSGTFDPADATLQAPGALVERLERACASTTGEVPASRADLVRAILESLAVAYAETIDQIEALTGRALTSVRIVGGGARNELLCALTAQRTGRPVIAGPAEASVRGILLQLAVASGHLTDLDTARRITVADGDQPIRRYAPAPAPVGMTPAEGQA